MGSTRRPVRVRVRWRVEPALRDRLWSPVPFVLLGFSCCLWPSCRATGIGSARRLGGSLRWARCFLRASLWCSLPAPRERIGPGGSASSVSPSFAALAWSCLRCPHGALSLPAGVRCRAFWAGRASRPVSSASCSPSWLSGARLWERKSPPFPGYAEVGHDARSVSREGAAVADWMGAHAPVDTRVLTGERLVPQVGWAGRMATLPPSATFPVWDLYMSPEPVRPKC